MKDRCAAQLHMAYYNKILHAISMYNCMQQAGTACMHLAKGTCGIRHCSFDLMPMGVSLEGLPARFPVSLDRAVRLAD